MTGSSVLVDVDFLSVEDFPFWILYTTIAEAYCFSDVNGSMGQNSKKSQFFT
jgi:hypothetical protein